MPPILKAPTPEQFKYICWVEEYYGEHSLYPISSIAAKALGFTVADIESFMANDTVIRMLDNRGIAVPAQRNDEQLSAEQLAAINCYLNIADPRPLNVKLKELGINPSKFHGWQNGKRFKEYIQRRAEELFQDGMPFAHRELMTKVMHGDIRAIKLFYEVSGRHTGVSSLDNQNVAVIIERLLEAIQVEVGDPELIQRIGKRFQSIAEGKPVGKLERVIPQAAVEYKTFGNDDPQKITYVRGDGIDGGSSDPERPIRED